MDLVIMAAGMGSRFGGLKQIEPIGPNGEFIIDYNIYDAIQNGFDRVVLIIKKEQEAIFRETIGKRLEHHVKVEYVYQEPNIPGVTIERTKPWGTAQAILCTKDTVKGPFAVINSDDYYGADCFKVLHDFLVNIKPNECGTVGYNVLKTITESGSVKRGVLEEKDNIVTKITESLIEKKDNKIYATKLGTTETIEIPSTTRVSMNALAFTQDIFKHLETGLKHFIETAKDLTKDEYLIPELIESKIETKELTLKMINTTAQWFGMTYKEDLDIVKEKINKYINDDLYPNNLWQ